MADRIHTEELFYWLISLFLNLLIFTFLSYLFLLRINIKEETPPLNVSFETPKQITQEVKFSKGRQAYQKPKEGKHTLAKGRNTANITPMIINRDQGDIALPSGRETQEDVSVLSQIEQKVKGRKETQEEGTRTKEIGEVSAVISKGGVGFAGGGGRGILYAPPLPKLVSEELPSTLKIKVWVEPSGEVSRFEVLQRSGVPEIDQKLIEFVKRIKFEPIRENILQTGVLIFRFKGG
ncbi:energy transducer TonB family protein [Hydrogenobacter hydrogenophilus]|uniref:Protein TonB n=1 Tax=Hydrogenobacter hydrogenophilus TaxID=35835 RepID=A0A285NVT9_9AQUI|nr:energy transducer TonB [Hydrogenobacter hydrogenophilus]SNZ13043.1 protein TonB [Hydrogenobacter hydrogenophilus]